MPLWRVFRARFLRPVARRSSRDRMRATKHAPGGPFRLLKCFHGLAEIVDRAASRREPSCSPRRWRSTHFKRTRSSSVTRTRRATGGGGCRRFHIPTRLVYRLVAVMGRLPRGFRMKQSREQLDAVEADVRRARRGGPRRRRARGGDRGTGRIRCLPRAFRLLAPNGRRE